jgi:hypothetical protein
MVALSKLTGKPEPTKEALNEIFVKADVNKDKKLSWEEIRSVLQGLVSVAGGAGGGFGH